MRESVELPSHNFLRRFAERFSVTDAELLDGYLPHRCNFFPDFPLHVSLRLILGNRSRGPLTALEHTEHSFTVTLQSIEP